MSTIDRFYTKTANVKRLAPSGGNPDISEYSVVSTFQCHIQQLDVEQTNLAGGVYGKTWRMWCKPDSDIKTSDNVEVDGIEYRVQGIDQNIHVDTAINKHLQCTIINDLSD